MLKVGLIGCGGMGSTHAAAYALLNENVKVVAVADVVAEKAEAAAKLVGAERIYNTGKELLANEKELDYVDICVPTYLHTGLAKEAMEGGLNVFLEKPVCMNEEEAQILLEAQKKTGAIVQIGLCCRFSAEYTYLKTLVEEGTYGKIKTAVFKRVSPLPKWSWENWYLDSSKSGYMSLDLHVHNVDFIRYLFGDPEKIDVAASTTEKGDIQHMFSTYKYGDAIVVTEDGWDFPDTFPFFEGYTAKFEKATITYDQNGLNVYTEEGETLKPELKKDCEANLDIGINVSSLGEYFSELKYFTETLNAGQVPDKATLADGVEAVRLVFKEVEIAKKAK